MATIKTQRREFIKNTTLGILALAAGGGAILSPMIIKAEDRLRPPGSVDEESFLALCIKCGQCVQVCPYHSIELSDYTMGHGVGTPFIDSVKRGCYACLDVPCVIACPSGALDSNTKKPEDIKMGIAVLQRKRSCLAVRRQAIPKGFNNKMKTFLSNQTNITKEEQIVLEKFNEYEGKACSLCADMCPMPNPLSAIAMVRTRIGITKPVVYDGCTGCGVCEEVCPVEDGPAIVIKPRITFGQYYG